MNQNNKNMSARRTVGLVLLNAGIVLIIAALLLFLYFLYVGERAGDASDAALEQVLQVVGSIPAEDEDTEIDEKSEDADTVPEMTVVWIDGYPYIGYLSVPSLGLELPVMAEWTLESLDIAPGRYYGSVFTDDLVIAGHNYRRHFSALKFADDGTVVIFTDMDGNDYYYEIARKETVRPTAIDTMIGLDVDEHDWDMTLFTCTTGGKARCAIRCVRTDR